MTFRSLSAAGLLACSLLAAVAHAGPTDLSFPPTSSAGHDFNHAPIGQSFRAETAAVRAGLHLADQHSFGQWLAGRSPDQTVAPYPYAVAPSIRVRAQLLAGEGSTGAVLHSRDLTLTAPYFGFVEFDYGAAGIRLTPGLMYTLLLTDISGQSYPNGVTGWVSSAVHDFSTAATLPPGAYANGLPILQGQIQFNDAGIGDNAFQAIDTSATSPLPPPPLPPPACSGNYAVVSTVALKFIEVNGGTRSADRVYYAPQAATTFTGGTTTFKLQERVSYVGTLDVASCHATQMTVYPVPTPVLVSGTLPAATVGIAYSATLTASGGIAPYSWSAIGLPAGLSFSNGAISGTPTVAGASTVTVDTADAIGQTTRTGYTLTVNPAAAPTCSASTGRDSRGTGKITALGSGYVMIGTLKLTLNSCTVIKPQKGSTALKVGQTVDWNGIGTGSVIPAKSIDAR
ncbi:MAG: Ig domain-containing protein [Gammaproteobacteria bacterium]|nr:Ig domain-containing protein [Gammaproteobacteria bacterium]